MDAHAELGDDVEPRRAAPKRQAKKPSLPKRGGRPKAAPTESVFEEDDPDLKHQLGGDQEGRNAQGVEGRENLYRSFLTEAIAQRNMMGKLRMKWAARVTEFKNQGVQTGAVNKLIKELGEDIDALVANENLLNQLRGMFGLPHGEVIELPSLVKGEAARDRLAEQDAVRVCWRGGSEKNCPYAADTVRGQKWIKQFRAEEDILRGGTPTAVMKHFIAA